ncbi:MAG TPA: SDR family oxidoreductase [Anaerolineae bacterium]|nr:SDR family oxidoreductase [Anaerolineae bacterium]
MDGLELHVIFGTGPVGQALAQALVQRGKTVKMINRSGRKPAGVPDRVTIGAGDVSDVNVAKDFARGAAVVYQCTNPPYDQWPELFPRLQANTLEAAAKAGAKYIVADNLYMYGDTDGRPLHEDLPYSAHTKKGKVRAQMAEAVMAAHRSGKVRVAVARASDFYGPAALGSVAGERMFGFAVQGRAANVAGDLDRPHTYTYIEDFGQALAVLGERDETLGQVWHVPNAETLTTRQFITLIFNELQQPPKMSALGRTLLRLGGLFIPVARESIEMLYEFEQPFIVDSSKFTRTFGIQGTPVREAIKATVAWYQQRVPNLSQKVWAH